MRAEPDPGGSEGSARGPGHIHVERRERSTVLATGTLACPSCDAPVHLGRGLSPGAEINCPVCFRYGRVRDFLSLTAPSRPAHVRVVVRGLR